MRRTVSWVLTMSLLGGCFGSFGLTQKVYDFNDGVSDSIVVQEVVFLAMVIVPVYELAALGDAVIFNLIEFATGSNPVASHRVDVEGAVVRFERTPKGVDVLVDDGQSVRRKSFRKRHSGWEILGGDGHLIARLVEVDGRVEVVDGAGVPLASLDAADLDHAAQAFQMGGSAALGAMVRPAAVWAAAR